MAGLLVNLDAMIPREDFSIEDKRSDSDSGNQMSGIGIKDLELGSLVLPNLRKPDFQRETNHWSPYQVVSLIQCYVNGDLIPSVILWKSPMYYFVIDGGHRLSALRAWIEDDYGDGAISKALFGSELKKEQKKAANMTRKKINESIGSWSEWKKKNAMTAGVSDSERMKISSVISRSMPLLWVYGNADKAEESFYKINKQGTPLDDIEEILVRNRKKPIPISARAIVRSGRGHKYWSRFSDDVRTQIESKAAEIHSHLFQPEISSPVKTLDLPLGGSAGIRQSLNTLMDFILHAYRDQSGMPRLISDIEDDEDGQLTMRALDSTLRLARRMTGNQYGSLGLHPAIYFYSASGKHSSSMFMGTANLIAKKMINNDKNFFMEFIKARRILEEKLVAHNDILAQIINQTRSVNRTDMISRLLENMINKINSDHDISEQSLIEMAGLSGKIFVGDESKTSGTSFSDTDKSKIFIRAALKGAIKCSICGGYLDVTKSVSYDHVDRKSNGGIGDASNCQLTHPYCNQAVKN